MDLSVLKVDYSDYTNRQLVAVPLALLALSIGVLAVATVMVGSPVPLGIEFTGGTELRIVTDDSPAEIEATFDENIESLTPIATQENTYQLTFQTDDADPLAQQAEEAGYEVPQISERSASFAADSQRQAIIGLLVAFAGMAALVFLMFRTFIPSIAVVASAFSDIMIPLALMRLFGIQLSLGTVAALLMLIGYSVDSDLLLNNHVIRRRGDFYTATFRAMRTGVTMTITSIAAMVVMAVAATLLGIPLLPEIGIVLVFGLTADLMNTYLLNVSLLRYYKYEAIAK
ncbi:protein translocase subunit SecF [Natronomonas marina]|uniref:protein translocase subunit SecF n=1 Tax=Natronomonas marina TaxID=2961939 RepID=UPI0020C9B648|nr:protein translocase subunit SecF [Natronomonas marina]